MSPFNADDVFALDAKIRWVGLATKRGRVIFAQMRPGVESITPESDDRLLLELRGQYITEVCSQVNQWAGPTEYIAMSHEKFIELIIILKEKYLAMTLEKSTPTEKFPAIAKKAQELWFNV